MNREEYAVFINTSANNGRAEKRWGKIKELVTNRLPPSTHYIEYSPPFDLMSTVASLWEQNVSNFIAVGGDGSLFYLLNALMPLNDGSRPMSVGAIGLGSSNDFCKTNSAKVDGYKFRIGKSKSAIVDVGSVTIDDGTSSFQKYFFSNASIGYLANANAYFNSNNSIVDFLKKGAVDLAINYTAIASLWSHKNQSLALDFNDDQHTYNISTLSILKSPHVAGDFRYPSQISPDDGTFDLKVCWDHSKWQLLRTLLRLYRKKFEGKNLASYSTDRLTIASDTAFFLELDGEIFNAVKANFKVLPRNITVLNFFD